MKFKIGEIVLIGRKGDKVLSKVRIEAINEVNESYTVRMLTSEGYYGNLQGQTFEYHQDSKHKKFWMIIPFKTALDYILESL